MAFTDIVHSGVMNFDRTDVSSFVDIISNSSELHFPIVVGGGGGETSYVF